MDSSCLILGSKWALGFHDCFNQGESQHSYWKKQLDPSPSFLPIQPSALWHCKYDGWVWFNPFLLSGFLPAGAASSVSTREGAAKGVRMGSWAKESQSCKYCQFKTWRLLLSFLYSQQGASEQILAGCIPPWKAPISCLVSSALFF